MLEKVIVRITYYISRVVAGIGVSAILIPICLSYLRIVFGRKSEEIKEPFQIYDWYSDILGNYGFIKVLIITVVALIIYKSTKPFVIEKTNKEKPEDIPTPSIETTEQNNSDDIVSLSNNFQEVLSAVKNNGMSLKYASNKMKDNREIVLAAVENDGLSLQYASE